MLLLMCFKYMPRGGQSIKYQYVNAKNTPLQIG